MDSTDTLAARGGELEARVKTGTGWLWSVVAFTIVNTILLRLGVDVGFCIGLVITQVADVAALQHVPDPVTGAHTGVLVGTLVLEALVVGAFALVARACSRGQRWWLLSGLVGYAFDTALAFSFQIWPSVVLHALTLGYGFRAFLAHFQLAGPPSGSRK